LSLFLEIHKVFLRKTAFIGTHFFSGFALAELCGVALNPRIESLARNGFNLKTCFSSSKLSDLIHTYIEVSRCAARQPAGFRLKNPAGACRIHAKPKKWQTAFDKRG